MQQSLTTVLRVPQAQSVVPSLRSGHYSQGPSGTLNKVVPSEVAPNYYLGAASEGTTVVRVPECL